MKNIKLIGATIGILLLTGCGSKPDVPKWYLNNEVGYITGTGTAKANESNDLNFQKDEAMLNARADLAKNLKFAVIAKDKKDTSKKQDEKIKKSLEFRIEAFTKKGLENTKVIKSAFMDDGTLFIKVGVRESLLKGSI
jgi:hypothetical protein